MKIHFIFNPASNNFKSQKVMDKVSEYLKSKNIEFFIHKTEYKGHAKIIASELTQDKINKKIICVGGDGTIHEVLNGIQDFEHTYFGIIPAGSANDFAINFKHIDEKDLSKCLNTIINDNWRYIDFMNVNDKIRAMNCIGFGLDANILKCYSKLKLFSQKIKYKIATIWKALFFSVSHCSFKLDENEQEFKCDPVLCIIGGGEWVGGGLKCNPGSKIDDNLLTMTYINKFSHFKIIHHLIKMMKTDAMHLKTARQYSAKKIKLTLDKKLYECDGEFYEDTNEITIKVVHEQLKFIC